MAGDEVDRSTRMLRTPRAAGVAFSLLLGFALILFRLSIPSIETEPGDVADQSCSRRGSGAVSTARRRVRSLPKRSR